MVFYVSFYKSKTSLFEIGGFDRGWGFLSLTPELEVNFVFWDRNLNDKICFRELEASGQVEPLPKCQSKVGPL